MSSPDERFTHSRGRGGNKGRGSRIRGGDRRRWMAFRGRGRSSRARRGTMVFFYIVIIFWILHRYWRYIYIVCVCAGRYEVVNLSLNPTQGSQVSQIIDG